MPQSAFLINDTLRNNIVFYKPFDIDRYAECIVKCGLYEDLKTFESKDLTEIGERGINLSGGQKQRIALARALYNESDIYLIDDALSALDAEVGKFIFDEVMKKNMDGSTRLLVTHATHLLDQVDEVILMKNGEIVANGSFDQVKNTKEFKQYNIANTENNGEEENEHHSHKEIFSNSNSNK